MGYEMDMADCDHAETVAGQPRVNLRADGALRHGAAALVQHGRLPPGSEFDHFRDVLEERRSQSLAWLGGPSEVSCFDRDDCEAYARWGTAADIVFGVIAAEGIFTATRRRKSLVEYWERCDKRASHFRELLRQRPNQRSIANQSPSQWLRQHAAQEQESR
jgi:hypothetical protein